MTPQTLEYGRKGPEPRVPRALVVLGTAVLGAYLIFQVVVVLTAPDRIVAVRWTWQDHRHLLAVAAVAGAIYMLLRWKRRDPERPISFLPVLSFVLVVLNPALTNPSLAGLGLRQYGGVDGVTCFIYGVAAAVSGTIGIVWVRTYRNALTGLRLAIAAVVGGGLWVVFWAIVLMVMGAGMRAF